MINAVKPGLAPNVTTLDPTKHRQNCILAVKVANSYLKIPRIISPDDLCSGLVDELSVMTYLSYFVEPFQAKLLKTVQKILPQFGIKGFSEDWHDGRAFGALLTACFPNLFVNWAQFEGPNAQREFVEELLKVARKRLGIRPPFKAADLVSGKVEELQIMTLIMQIKSADLVSLPDEIAVRGRGIEEADFQKETSFVIDTSEAGPGKLDIDAFYEDDGRKLKFRLVEKSKQVFGLTYTPTFTSNIIFNIMWSETPIPRSPFTVPVTDSTLVKIVNFDTHSTVVEAGKPIALEFEAKDGGKGRLNGYLQYGREKIHAVAMGLPNGNIRLGYTPTRSGTAVLHIFWNKEELKHLAVTYTVVDIGGYSVQALPRNKVYCIFEEPEFCVHSGKGLPLDVLQMTAVMNLDVQVPIHFTSVDGNRGYASFTPTLPGVYQIEVVCVDQLIKGTPFSVRVTDPHSCRIRGEIPSFLRLGEPHDFKVDTKEAGIGSLTFESSDRDISTCFRTHLEPSYANDLQTLQVTPLEEGEFLVGVKYQGHWISNSPFRVQVCDPTKFRVAEKLGLANVGNAVEFTVRSAERLENGMVPQIKASGPSAKYSPQVVKSESGLAFSVKFIPWEIGEHEITVRYGDFDIPNTPIHFPVVSFDADACSAAGSGLQRAYTNIPAQFLVLSKQNGLLDDGTLKITVASVIDGRECRIRARDNKNGTYSIAYLIDTAGAYLISIQTAGRHIPGSPFKLNALPGPEAHKCRMYGPALDEETILTFGKPIEFTVDTSKGGMGKLKVKAVGPDNTSARVFVAKTDRPGKYDINVDALTHGKHRVSVKWSGQHIPSSPFLIKVFPGADARKCLAYGPGLEDGHVGKKSSFTIETKNAGAGLLKVRLHGIKGAFKIEIAPVDQKNRRTLLANYNPTQPGEYLITIKWCDINVPGSPFRVRIVGDGTERSAVPLVVYTPTPRLSEDLSAFEEIGDDDEEDNEDRKPAKNSSMLTSATPTLLQTAENAERHTPIPATFRHVPKHSSTPSQKKQQQQQQGANKIPKAVSFGHIPHRRPVKGGAKRKQGSNSRINGQVTVRVANPNRNRLKNK